MTDMTPLEHELAEFIINELNLEDISVEDIEPEAALFNEGLGLDSIDTLELSMALTKTYGITIKADDANNAQIFSSLRALAKHVADNRTK